MRSERWRPLPGIPGIDLVTNEVVTVAGEGEICFDRRKHLLSLMAGTSPTTCSRRANIGFAFRARIDPDRVLCRC